ncbi:adventurous gliding motility lipoprotein CglB [Aggregicoccus sp. 17bor-14]|uniref:adventurous gliding motility lipoprotein CglB n=1 Tax=Myxococcaceae TaxID=31 RepID=UPI00129D1DBF|nr:MULTISPECIES: adventurous gliding motility lipoprotein CglB [Myxococcaceae]MBF5041186.1 adventurous gliding motility lipoprotein CglB [Simulacricoccus sp. 17bor-14]MRI86973.1 adventurous gliding motility lipoprotein CglB [Aggregicoccus sp. 17bor-14]
MRAKLTILSALAVGIAAGAIAGCQTYDFEPVNPLALGQTTVLNKVVAKGETPNMMMLVDTSGSMNTPVACGSGTCPTRWQELQGAMKTFLTGSGTVARLGLTTFPDTQVGNPIGPACTASSKVDKDLPAPGTDETAVQLQARANEINAILQKINSGQSGAEIVVGGTPTSVSLQFVGGLPALQDPDRENLVLLLTDGLPNCNPNNPASGITDPAACRCTLGTNACNDAESERLGCLDKDVSVQRVEELASRGIRTIVIGFGAETTSGTAVEVLNAMAEKGGFARPCAPGQATCTKFYPASNQQELAAQLAAISGLLPGNPCLVPLTTEQLPSDDKLLVVKLTADGVTRTAEQGTDYQLNRTGDKQGVEMIGATCERIKQSTPRDPVTLEVFAVQPK